MSKTKAKLRRELLTGVQVGEVLGCSKQKVSVLHARGLLPEPIKFGPHGENRWRREELIDWIRAGCPDRGEWFKIGWPPRVVMKMSAYVALLTRRAVELNEQAKEYTALAERGHKLVTIQPER
jgi:predicted DNA-binding transcriptional regulator AlpA